ncbi:MAG: hypothetical protein Q9171_002565 [Xanthocarpia ochracea]
MDVTGQDFYRLLPCLLEAIADAHFVAIDLEFSGISNRGKSRLKASNQHTGGTRFSKWALPVLGKIWTEARLLVPPLSLVAKSQNPLGVYVVRPYNFNLNPFPDERMNIQRDVTLQGRAMQFLYRHSFRIEGPFHSGVHYLSRAEEAEERQVEAQLRDRVDGPGVQPRADDTRSLEFLERVRQEVLAWKSRPTMTPDFINIAPTGHDQPPYPDKGLNNFQKLLVHQYIRTEHPDLTTASRLGFIQISAHDQERQDAEKQHRAKTFEERLARQVGLRWLVEAMQGGDLTGINADNFGPATGSRKGPVTSKFNSVRSRLRGHSTVLVGHNLFLDLIYLYACFFGPLPDKVEDFQRIIHDLFPRIIDTKFLAAHNDPGTTSFNLEELDRLLSQQPQPVIEASGKYIEELPSPVNDAFYTPPEGECDDLIDFHDVSEQLEAIDRTSSKSSSQPSSDLATSRTTFSHATKFDLLGNLSDEVDPFTLRPRTSIPQAESESEPETKIDNETGRRLPAWESDFWKVYGNKVRVNGTIEGVCNLGSWPQ